MTLNGLKRWPADPELELKFSQSDNWEWKHHAINGADLTLGQPNRHEKAGPPQFHQGVRTGNSKNEEGIQFLRSRPPRIFDLGAIHTRDFRFLEWNHIAKRAAKADRKDV